MVVNNASLPKINSHETHITILNGGTQSNKSPEKVTSKKKVDQESWDQNSQKDSGSVIPKTSSVKFISSYGSIVLHEHNYETDRSRSVSNTYILSGALDTVQSGESLIKYFYFDSSKYNSETNKCVAFWDTIMAHNNIKPIECVFKVSNFDFSSGCEKVPHGEQEDVLKLKLEESDKPQEYIWFNALIEMKKKKLDQLALSATDADCKLCDPKRGLSKIKRKTGNYTQQELKDYEDIVCLNCWVPKSVKKAKPGEKRDSYNIAKLRFTESLSSGSSEVSSNSEMVCGCLCTKCECASLTRKKKSGDEGSVCKCTCDPGQCACFCVTGEEAEQVKPEKIGDNDSVCKCTCEPGRCVCFCVVDEEEEEMEQQRVTIESLQLEKGDEGSVCKCTCEPGQCSCFCVVEEEPIKLEKPGDVDSTCPCICEPGECICTCATEKLGIKPEKGDDESVCKCTCAPGECTCSCVADLLTPIKEDEDSVCKCTCAPGECTCSCVADLLKPEKIGDEGSVCKCTCEPGECTCSCVADLIKSEKGDEDSVCKCTCAPGECTCSCVADLLKPETIADDESVCKCTCEPGECTCSCVADLLKSEKIGDEESVCKCTCAPGECTCSCVADLLKPEKIGDEESVCKCTCEQGECTCSCVLGSDTSDFSVTESECSICQKEKCTCKEYFEKEANEFVNKVRYELQNLRKEVACSTEEDKVRPKTSHLNFCSVCDDKTMCDIMHNRIKTLELIIPAKEEDIYFETIFESLNESSSLSTTILPVPRKTRKSTAFNSVTRASYFRRLSNDPTKSFSGLIKPFEKKRREQKEKLPCVSRISSKQSAKVGETQKIERRSLLWYSTDTPRSK